MTLAQIDALIATLSDNARNPASKARLILTAIKNETCKLREIKMIPILTASIPDFFDGTGLGYGEYLGYALANGNNGTDNYTRRVPIGYDATTYVSGFNYSVVGQAFGEEKHTLTQTELPTNNRSVHTDSVTGATAGGGSGREPWNPDIVNYGGNDTPHNNVQPSKVTLFIQRIS